MQFDTDNQFDDTPFTFDATNQEEMDEQFEQFLASYNYSKYQEELLNEMNRYFEDEFKPD